MPAVAPMIAIPGARAETRWNPARVPEHLFTRHPGRKISANPVQHPERYNSGLGAQGSFAPAVRVAGRVRELVAKAGRHDEMRTPVVALRITNWTGKVGRSVNGLETSPKTE